MPKYNNPRKTWQYSNEFKVKSIRLSLIEGVQYRSGEHQYQLLSKDIRSSMNRNITRSMPEMASTFRG